eukprot:gene7800-42455_t
MFFIEHGSVEVVQPDDTGGRCLATLRHGSWFGEVALLLRCRRTATVRTLTATRLLRLEKDDFVAILAAFPEL